MQKIPIDNHPVYFLNENYTLVLPNLRGFNHQIVKSKFEGNPEYIATLSYYGSYWAFYYVENPDLSKNHKKIMILGDKCVTGITLLDYKKNYNTQLGKACTNCKEIIYSVYRHDYRHCSCGEVMVDGGSDYFRCSKSGKNVSINFLERYIIEN